MTRKTANQTRELGDDVLDQVQGGYIAVKLENAKVTSYSINGSGQDDGTDAGGGPHIRVFSSSGLD